MQSSNAKHSFSFIQSLQTSSTERRPCKSRLYIRPYKEHNVKASHESTSYVLVPSSSNAKILIPELEDSQVSTAKTSRLTLAQEFLASDTTERIELPTLKMDS